MPFDLEIPHLEGSDLLSPWAPATKPSITSAGTRGTIVLPGMGSGVIQGSSTTASHSPGQSTCDGEKGRASYLVSTNVSIARPCHLLASLTPRPPLILTEHPKPSSTDPHFGLSNDHPDLLTPVTWLLNDLPVTPPPKIAK